MCEQCRAFDVEDDRDALAAAFYSSYGKAVPSKRTPQQSHALLNHNAAPPVAAATKKAAR